MTSEEHNNQSCNDPAIWQTVLSTHEISKEEFENRLQNYFGGNPPTMLRMSGEALCAYHENCEEKSWQYDPKATTNDELDLKLEAIRATHQYSLALFRGLAYWNNAASYEFSLGLDERGKKSVVFVAYNGLDVAIYYGNISNLMP